MPKSELMLFVIIKETVWYFNLFLTIVFLIFLIWSTLVAQKQK